MIDTAKMTIKELSAIFADNSDEELIKEICAAAKKGTDNRKALAQLVRRRERADAEKARVAALYRYEREAYAEGAESVAGVDEAGRGPLAGPVSVAAVILPREIFLPKLNDSKKISPKVREELYDLICEKALCVRQVFVDEKIIDSINIFRATIKGMYQAIAALEPPPQKVLIDAVKLPELNAPQLSLINGDALSASIAAASIIAKVARDRLMIRYDKQYPQYGFAANKGYGTAEHMAAIRKYGLCPLHRRSFTMPDRDEGY